MAESPVDRRTFLERASTVAGSLAASTLASGIVAGDEPSRGMPPDLARPTSPGGADIGSLAPLIQRLAETNEYDTSFLTGRFASIDEFKAAGRAKVTDAFRFQPERVPLQPEVVDRQETDDWIREKVLFSTSPVLHVPAYIHLPKRQTGPAPAIVDLHSHGGMFLFGKEKVIDFGTNHPVMRAYHQRNYGGRPTTTELVRRGYVVISTDAFMFGERRLMMDEDLQLGWDRSRYSVEVADRLNQRCRSKESTLAKSMVYAGTTWPGIVTWDDMRTVDYLVSRPEVDPQRIGCVGVSFGGWRTLFLAGMDERIAAACVVGFMSTVKSMLHRHIDTHSWVHFLPGLHGHLDLPDVVSMMAPKPLMVQQCRQDGLFPPTGMQESVDKIARVYERAGVANHFTGRFFDGGHRFDVPMQDEAFQWFDQHMKT
ncbi:MAG: dienelactone hydrolase family protein [Pirellulaceae bacterium]